MDGLIVFWKYVCILGLIGFYIPVLYIIPAGAKDLLIFFRKLREGSEKPPEGDS